MIDGHVFVMDTPAAAVASIKEEDLSSPRGDQSKINEPKNEKPSHTPPLSPSLSLSLSLSCRCAFTFYPWCVSASCVSITDGCAELTIFSNISNNKNPLSRVSLN